MLQYTIIHFKPDLSQMAAVAVVRTAEPAPGWCPALGPSRPAPPPQGYASACAQPTQSGATRLPSLKIESAAANEPVLSGLGLGRQRATNEPVLSGPGLSRESAATLYGPASTGARGQPLSGFGPARVTPPPSQTGGEFGGRSPQTGQPLPQRARPSAPTHEETWEAQPPVFDDPRATRDQRH